MQDAVLLDVDQRVPEVSCHLGKPSKTSFTWGCKKEDKMKEYFLRVAHTFLYFLFHLIILFQVFCVCFY